MPIIVVDGASGSGKTTTLFGRSQEDPSDAHHKCLKDLGFNVVEETVHLVFQELRKKGECPNENLELVVRKIIDAEIKRYDSSQDKNLYFFDRSIISAGLILKGYGAELPYEFYESCSILRYSSPILLFQPIPSCDLSKPRPGRSRGRIYTWEQRLQRHEKTKRTYNRQGYEVIEIPVYSLKKQESINQRIRKILEIIDTQ
jgi:predicted ATPase